MMNSNTVTKILKEIKQLSLPEKVDLLQKMNRIIKKEQIYSRRKKHTILELKGLGKDIWVETNTDDYLNRERESWK